MSTMKIYEFLFKLILLSLPFFCVEVASRASFGEKCSKEIRCNSQSILTCSNESLCVCQMPDTMIYDNSSGKCVTLAGEHCQFTTIEGEQSWTDQVPCISNATCSNISGICECTTDYFELSNGTCQRSRNFGQECLSNAMCISSKRLTCGPEQTCICHNNSTYYSHWFSGGQCGLKPGQQCSPSDTCVLNSVCRRGNSYRYSSDSKGICTCNERYFPSENGTCILKGSFGESCRSDIQCNSNTNYVCNTNTNKCECKKGKGYHPWLKLCLNSPNEKCSTDERYEGKWKCVLNAECKLPPGERYSQICTCNEGAIPFGGLCLIPENNGTCDGDMSGPPTEKMCLPGLVCRDSRCTCLYKDHQVYNESGSDQKCVSLLGGPCNATSNCTRNSECLPNKGGFMECQCKEGFTPAGRHCDIAYSQKCVLGDLTSKCDRYGPLECSVRGICECSEFQIYDKSTLKCRGLVGAKCGEDGVSHKFPFGRREQEEEELCVEGALCKPFRGVVSGLCACKDGWVLEEDRTCNLESSTTTASATAMNI